MRNINLVIIISLLLLINGWKFLNGEMVHLRLLGTKDISVPFRMDPDLESTLHYIRTLPQDGRILTLPLTDFGYQLIGGVDSGMYMGPSMIGHLTNKKDYTSYNGFGNQNELLLTFIKEKNYKALKNIFSIHNIRYVYFNEDPYVFNSFSGFPYENTKEVLPTLDSYENLIQSLDLEEIFKKGSYHIYRFHEVDYSPILYATNTILYTESSEDMEYILPFYSFAPARLAVVPGTERGVVRAKKIDIYTRINKDYPLPVWYPFAKWKLGSPVYPVVIFKENSRIGCISGYVDPEIDCDLFYSFKRLSELKRWEGGIPVVGNFKKREDLLAWKEPNLFNFYRWNKYNSWEASLARYVKGIETVVHFIENADRGLAWKVEKKSKVKELLLENERFVNLVIKNSPKGKKDKVYLKQLVDGIFSYYLEKVKVNTYDPSYLEYVISNNSKLSGAYEILVKQNDEKIELKDIVFSIEDKEYRPLTDYDDGWLHFGEISSLNKESLATLKIPQVNLASASSWQEVSSVSTEPGSTRLETIGEGFENFITQINNVTSPGHYLLSFDYLSNGDIFEIQLFVFEKTKSGKIKRTQLFQEPKLSDVWRKMSAVVEVEKPADFVVQIKPSEETRSIDVKNLSFVKLPYHPETILRKVNTQESSQIPDISFAAINPTKYKIDVRNVSHAYMLVFSQAFNKKWNLIDITKNDTSFVSNVERFLGRIGRVFTRTFDINTAFMNENTFETWGKRYVAQDSHMVANGYANAWRIHPADMEETDYMLVLEITSQRTLYYYILGAMIALTTSIIFVIGVQLAGRFKNRR